MDEIIKKLTASGISPDMIEKLKTGLGGAFESEIMTNGIKAAAAKVGIDATTLPDIDFKGAANAFHELMGKDVDGDGKTGVMEAVESAQKAIANSDMSAVQKTAGGLFSKVKGLFGK